MRKINKPTIFDVDEVLFKVRAFNERDFDELYYLIMTYYTFGTEYQKGYDKVLRKMFKRLVRAKIITRAEVNVIWCYLKLPDDTSSDSGYVAFRFVDKD